MTSTKIRQSLFPTIAGVLTAFFLLYFYNELMATIYSPKDGDKVFAVNAFYFPLFLFAVVPIILIAGIFQFFVAIPIWEYYKKEKTLFKLKLWQLTFIASVIFGTSVSIVSTHKFATTNQLLLNISCATIITLAYWFVNLSILKYLNREKSIS